MWGGLTSWACLTGRPTKGRVFFSCRGLDSLTVWESVDPRGLYTELFQMSFANVTDVHIYVFYLSVLYMTVFLHSMYVPHICLVTRGVNSGFRESKKPATSLIQLGLNQPIVRRVDQLLSEINLCWKDNVTCFLLSSPDVGHLCL